ncbi:MAG: acylneuraminate cytidylyltransferase [Lachnospiraceae bacterium]|nr:acylneuraminate cytidylyltransferase [Lachnospiraceae bacterium]
MNILAVIPARSGSKSVKDKNIRPVAGKPLLAYSVEHALASSLINRTILSTDSERYAEIGRQYGAEVPFIRPAEFATDDALDIDVFRHALTYLKEKEGYEADIVVHLRPTYPKRRISDIDAMIRMLIDDPHADSVRSLAPAAETPYKMWWYDNTTGRISPILRDIKEAYNMPRQELPMAFSQNACIDVVRARTILEKNSMTGEKILGYPMQENYDIDTEEELRRAEAAIKEEGASGPGTGGSQVSLKGTCTAEDSVSGDLRARAQEGKLRLVFDIDGVIAKLEPNNDYSLSEPDTEMIATVNRLYDEGNTIVLHTARGYATGIDWTELTKKRLSEWGVRYHELVFGKPNADYYIDDRSLPLDIARKL